MLSTMAVAMKVAVANYSEWGICFEYSTGSCSGRGQGGGDVR